MKSPSRAWRYLAACLLGSGSFLACGQIEIDPVPDLPAPVANCLGDECACPPGSHLAEERGDECQYCPFGTVNTDPHATSCVRSQIVAGNEHTCVLVSDGRVRCWGSAFWGQLGYGNTESVGDDEPPRDAGDVQLSGRAIQIAAGGSHTCALLQGGDVRCWGHGSQGRLGLGDEESIGDDERPIDRPVIDLGEPALQIAAGGAHTCALLQGGRVRCWGSNESGTLGNGDIENIGDDEPPRVGLDVDLGEGAKEVTLGNSNGCALLETGHTRCWGIMDFRYLTAGDLEVIRSPAQAGDLPLPQRIEQISLGVYSACTVSRDGALRCWGQDAYGELGYGELGPTTIEDALRAPDVPVGGSVVQVRTWLNHTCAILSEGNVRCWGGVPLGYPETWPRQSYTTPEDLGDIDVGGVVTDLALGVVHTCALLSTGAVRCWGFGGSEQTDGTVEGGWLGYGNTEDIGDDETPASAGDVPYL
jgi:alpha-tubulin suppressor-like RCC1 family protein